MKKELGFANLLVGVGAVLSITPLVVMVLSLTSKTHDKVGSLVNILWSLTTGVVMLPLGLALFLGGLGIMFLKKKAAAGK
jgi:hypothetical protein